MLDFLTAARLPDRTHADLSPQAPHLSRVTELLPNGRVNLELVVYFATTEAPVCVQARVGWRGWRSLQPSPADGPSYWRLAVTNVRIGTAVRFRYRVGSGAWLPIAPLTDLERVFATSYVPKPAYSWKHQCPDFNHGFVLMETTLESLLAGFEGSVFAPRSREEMFRDPIARELLRTDIPNRLAELGINGILATLTSSVADRSYLDPRFNYLTYDLADIDWQIGSTQDVRRAIDKLYGKGIQSIPEVVFHQVKTPFPGSLDAVGGRFGEQPFVDTEAFQHRNYGTWEFDLADANLRQLLIEKIATHVARLRLTILCLRGLDSLIYQYSQRAVNFGEVFLQELRAELQRCQPQLRILGEVFAARDNPVVRDCVDIYFAPYGFEIVEQTFAPPGRNGVPDGLDFSVLAEAIEKTIGCQQQNAVYAMLHDETYPDEHVAAARPETPWAYGAYPAELARAHGEKFVRQGDLPEEDLLDYVRRRVRNTEAMTLFATRCMYIFSPAADSLVLETALSPNNWKFQWESITPKQLSYWRDRGVPERETYLLHQQHRLDMVTLRQIFQSFTVVSPETLKPLTQVALQHRDPENRTLAIWRHNPDNPVESIWVIFNLGFVAFGHGEVPAYVLPKPHGSTNSWEVLFDGDWIDPLLWTEDRQHYLDTNFDVSAYPPGHILDSLGDRLSLRLGAHSLIVLKVQR